MGVLKLSDISKNLTEAVLERAFKISTQSNDSIKSIEITPATAAGEGLISAVYRIIVRGHSHKSSFIVKGLVSDLLLRKTLDCVRFFKREAQFFEDVLPILVETQKASGAKERIQSIVPLCYSCHCDGENDYILMQDMIEDGCTGVSEDITVQELEMTLKSIAHLHATSMALRVKNSDDFVKLANSLKPDVYYREDLRKWYGKYLQTAIEIDLECLAEYEDANGVYYKKFLQVTSNDAYGQLIYLTSSPGEHAVFNHGDAWCPNFLNCKDRIVAIDFQLLRCCSPVCDATYFVMMLGNVIQNKKHFDDAMKKYYDALCYFLEDMGLKSDEVFSWEDFEKELKKYGRIGLLAALSSIPLRASDNRVDVLDSFDNFAGLDKIPLEELWQLKPLKDEKHKIRLVNMVKVAVDAGLI